MSHTLPYKIVKNILEYLGCRPRAPSLHYLDHLISAYLRRVPWESVSRIVKRQLTVSISACPRWPEEFWDDAMALGLGGTCFESSLAFYSLLVSLGYEGYLTVNDMGNTRGCHAAAVVFVGEHKHLVDITIPIHRAIRIDSRKATTKSTFFHDYKLVPVRENVYEVLRSHHPSPNMFTLIDVPVSLSDYRAIVTRDYLETGHFLKSVVVVKVIDDKVYRFFSDHRPYRIEGFNRDGKSELTLQPEVLAPTLARLFLLPENKISAALTLIQNTS